MRGRRGSTAEAQTERPAPLEIYGDDETTKTAVGSQSVARALLAIRRQRRTDDDEIEDEDALETLYSVESIEPPTPRPTLPAPASPKSDIREIAAASEDSDGGDPLEQYVSSILEPAIEDAKRKSGTRVRRETMKMDMRPRQPTLPMIDRPLAQPLPPPAPPSSAQMPVEIRTPAVALVPPVNRPVETPPPQGNKTVLIVAFLAGILLALGVGAALTFGPFHL